jgi:hypothetical protein
MDQKRPQTVIVTEQPKANSAVFYRPPGREWTHGLCGCFNDCGDCKYTNKIMSIFNSKFIDVFKAAMHICVHVVICVNLQHELMKTVVQ